MTEKTSGQKDALTVALKFISLRPRSKREVADKLKLKGFAPPEIDSCVDELVKAGYLDDEKYAALLSESRIRNKSWGPLKILNELELKGIPKEIIKKIAGTYSAGLEADTAALALKKWLKRKGLAPELDRKGVEKAFRFLKGRGFPSPVIFKALGGLKDHIEE
ncbi:MAG: regulatory protein RecX [Deltaproteobacteria bacterium]|nr:regulatory protein RecX [Deltaproteobacteria bacterium]